QMRYARRKEGADACARVEDEDFGTTALQHRCHEPRYRRGAQELSHLCLSIAFKGATCFYPDLINTLHKIGRLSHNSVCVKSIRCHSFDLQRARDGSLSKL